MTQKRRKEIEQWLCNIERYGYLSGYLDDFNEYVKQVKRSTDDELHAMENEMRECLNERISD
jgi:hypothetical protein